MKTIEQQWKTFWAGVAPPNAAKNQETEMRKAFICGAHSMFHGLVDMVGPGKEPTDVGPFGYCFHCGAIWWEHELRQARESDAAMGLVVEQQDRDLVKARARIAELEEMLTTMTAGFLASDQSPKVVWSSEEMMVVWAARALCKTEGGIDE